MRALHTAATGMMAQELNVQVISNNIANMRTTGYKRQRAQFSDLLYEHVRRIGTQTSDQGNILPVGVDLGSGVKTVGTPRLMTQGTLAPVRFATTTASIFVPVTLLSASSTLAFSGILRPPRTPSSAVMITREPQSSMRPFSASGEKPPNTTE